MEAPIIKEPIPDQVINELAAFGPEDLKEFVQNPDGTTEGIRYQAGLKDGGPLPKGMICTENGLLTGIPAKGTEGVFEVVVTATNEAGSIDADMTLIIQAGLVMDTARDFNDLKAEIWAALEDGLPVPDMDDVFGRDISPGDIYYLLERWGIIIIWDAFNLDPPSEKQLLTLEGCSEHYNIFDRGSSLIGAPKELFSHERTTIDGIKTAKAMAGEVYKRGWTVELAGFDKFLRAAWVEIEQLGDKHGKKLEVVNFSPSEQDKKAYMSLNKDLGA